MRSNGDSPRCRSAAALLAVLLLASCHTYTAVVDAPPGFWVTLESIVWAVVQDVTALLEFLL
jgi:hypothetical protein